MQVKDDRLAQLERELKYTRWAMLTLALVVLGCSGVTERFERCFSREYVIESKSESPLGEGRARASSRERRKERTPS